MNYNNRNNSGSGITVLLGAAAAITAGYWLNTTKGKLWRKKVSRQINQAMEECGETYGPVVENATKKANEYSKTVKEEAANLKEKVVAETSNLKEKATEVAGNLKEKANETASTLKTKASEYKETAAEKANELKHTAEAKISEIKENAADKADKTSNKTSDAVQSGIDRAKERLEQLDKNVDNAL